MISFRIPASGEVAVLFGVMMDFTGNHAPPDGTIKVLQQCRCHLGDGELSLPLAVPEREQGK